MTGSIVPQSAEMPFQARIGRPSYFDALLRHGYRRFGVYNRHYSPLGYSDPHTEYRELLDGVVLWPVAGERQLEIAGPDAAAFTQYLTPRDLGDMPVGRCRYVLITAEDGGIVNDPVCLRLAEERFWLSAADSDLLLWARGVNAVLGHDVTLRDPGVAVLQVQGPRSRNFIAALAGPRAGALRFFDWTRCRIADAPVVVSRTGWSNEWGYEIYIEDPTTGNAVFDHIVDTGAAHDLRLGTVSQIRRVEGGLLSWGADFGLTETPFEVGLERLVSFRPELDYIGRAALERRAATSSGRRLTGVMFPGQPHVIGLDPPTLLDADGQAPIGHVTSLVHSPRLAASIGFAIVPDAQSAPGNQVCLEIAERCVPGRTAALPFVPHRRTESN